LFTQIRSDCCSFTPSGYRPHYKSKWFERINFLVTHFTSYFNERSKDFTHKECEEHFYPDNSHSNTEIDYAEALSPLNLFDFTAILSICSSMFAFCLLALFAEITFSNLSNSKSYVHNSNQFSKLFQFSYKFQTVTYTNVVEKCNQLQNLLFVEYGIVILRSEIQTKIIEGVYEITFSLALEINALNHEQIIKNKLQAFIFFLDTASVN
jgi:hypothetical protein